MVTEGQPVGSRYKVTKIGADAVELEDLLTHAIAGSRCGSGTVLEFWSSRSTVSAEVLRFGEPETSNPEQTRTSILSLEPGSETSEP